MAKTLNNSTTVTLNKLQIEKFEINPQTSALVIHYSTGYENQSGDYVPVKNEFINLSSVAFNQTLYGQVKEELYAILMNHLNIS